MNQLKDLLTVKQAAKLLKKHPSTIRRWIKDGKLEATKLSGKYGIYLIPRSNALEFAIQNLMDN